MTDQIDRMDWPRQRKVNQKYCFASSSSALDFSIILVIGDLAAALGGSVHLFHGIASFDTVDS